MRIVLAQMTKRRHVFRGSFIRYGNERSSVAAKTVLLEDICTGDDTPVCNHLWLLFTYELSKLDLQEFSRIEFTARIFHYRRRVDYEDGSRHFVWDYKLGDIMNARLIEDDFTPDQLTELGYEKESTNE